MSLQGKSNIHNRLLTADEKTVLILFAKRLSSLSVSFASIEDIADTRSTIHALERAFDVFDTIPVSLQESLKSFEKSEPKG